MTMNIPDNFQFFCPVKISAGNKALEHLPSELEWLGAELPLVISNDKGRAKTVVNAFKNSDMTVCLCDNLPKDPVLDTVQQLTRIYREAGCDALVAVGSGGLADVAKAVNIQVSLTDIGLESCTGENRVPRGLNPLVLLPTPSGTGLETSRYAALGGLAFSSPFLMPDLVTIDRRLIQVKKTDDLLHLALAALTHAVEAYGGPSKNPMTDAYAFGAIRLVMENLVAVIDGSDKKSGPSALVNAAAMAGCALSNTAPGMIHLIAEAAMAGWDLPPGLALGILLPYVMEYHTLKDDYHSADLLLPLAGSDVYATTAEDLRGAIAVNVVHALLYDLNKAAAGALPLTLEAAGIAQEALSGVAERAADAHPNICEPKSVRLILEHAWSGYPIVSL